MAKTLDKARDTLESQLQARIANLEAELHDLTSAASALHDMLGQAHLADEITLVQRAAVIQDHAAHIQRTTGKLAALIVACRELAEIEIIPEDLARSFDD